MIKKIFVALLCTFVMNSMFAQGFGGMGRQMDPEKQAAQQAKQITKKCKLTDEQHDKIYEIILKDAQEQSKQMEEMMKQFQNAQGGGGRPQINRDEMEKRQQEAQDRQLALEDQLKEVMTEAQFKKYEKWRKQQQQNAMNSMSRMMGRGGFGGGMGMMGGGGFGGGGMMGGGF